MNQRKLETRQHQLEKLVATLGERIAKLPEGRLRVEKHKRGFQYYHVTEQGGLHGQYLKTTQRPLAAKLAQKQYYEKLQSAASRESRAISAYLRGMPDTAPENIYEELAEGRKVLVRPVLESDAAYARHWQEEVFQGNPFKPEELVYPSNRGEMMRSKSEALIADILDELGIPYRYEWPLSLSGGQTRYPDFTLLRIRDRKLIYLEHLGKLEDEGYRQKNLIKLADYAKNGIYVGRNLLLTFETDYAPLDLVQIRKMLKYVFRTSAE